MNVLSQYYGIDWLASVFALLMIYFLGNKNPVGFMFGMAANVSWIGFAVLTTSIPIAIANIIFFTLNFRGLLKWKKLASM